MTEDNDSPLLEDMLISLVDLLIEKGIITQEEYDTKVGRRIAERSGVTFFKDLED